MRIVLASFTSLPHTIGGGEVHMLALAGAFQELGHQPSILTIEQTGIESVSLRRDYLAGVPVDYLKVPACISPYSRDPRLSTWAKAWLKEEKVDVVHLFLFNHLLGLIPAARELRIPVVLTALEFSYFCRRYGMMYEGRELCKLGRRGLVCERCALKDFSSKQRLLASIARLLPPSLQDFIHESGMRLMRTDKLVALGQLRITRQVEAQRSTFNDEIAAVITPSSIMRQFYIANGVDEFKLHFIPYGTDVVAESNKEPEHKQGSKELRVGYIGRIHPSKGVEVLCEAVQMLPRHLPINVKIFGPLKDGPQAGSSTAYVSRIKSLIEGDQRLQLLGPTNREDLRRTYDNIDVLVVPSTWYENSPITITEALAFKCPVVCSATPGMTDLIQDGVNGLTFPMGDRAALADCLRRLVEERELLDQLRSRIRPVESSLDIAGKVIRLYKNLPEGTAERMGTVL